MAASKSNLSVRSQINKKGKNTFDNRTKAFDITEVTDFEMKNKDFNKNAEETSSKETWCRQSEQAHSHFSGRYIKNMKNWVISVKKRTGNHQYN